MLRIVKLVGSKKICRQKIPLSLVENADLISSLLRSLYFANFAITMTIEWHLLQDFYRIFMLYSFQFVAKSAK